jgi:hypothetical protein
VLLKFVFRRQHVDAVDAAGREKSSSTARPRRSASVSGRATLNQVSPAGNSTLCSAWARGRPMVSSPPATTMAARKVSTMRFMAGFGVAQSVERITA